MANLSKTTQDHDEIRRWAEERGGKPAHVKSTESKEDVGILRIDFPGFSGEGSLEEISWEQWFEKFDDRNLALIYQETTAEGERSNFNKIVSAETAAESETRQKATSKKRSAGAAKKAVTPGKKAVTRKAPANNASAKKTAKKAVGQKAASNRAALEKAATKKTVAKKTAAKKAVKKTAPLKKAGGKKAAAKRRR